MALSAAGLSTAIQAALTAAPTSGFTPGAAGTAYCDALASAIVNYIKDNAEVQPGDFTTDSDADPIIGTGYIT